MEMETVALILFSCVMQDDPICVAARRDGKVLVNGLWVEHSYDSGMPVDPTRVCFSCTSSFSFLCILVERCIYCVRLELAFKVQVACFNVLVLVVSIIHVQVYWLFGFCMH